jgi:hypothetical protein
MRQGQLGRSRGGLAAPWLTAPATFASNKPLSRVVLCLVAGITAPKAAGRIWEDLGDVIFTKTIEAQGNHVLEHYQTRERISAPCTSKHAFFLWVTRMATLPTERPVVDRCLGYTGAFSFSEQRTGGHSNSEEDDKEGLNLSHDGGSPNDD